MLEFIVVVIKYAVILAIVLFFIKMFWDPAKEFWKVLMDGTKELRKKLKARSR